MQPPLESAVSPRLLDWLKIQKQSVQLIPTWHMSKKKALMGIKRMMHEYGVTISAFKWGKGQHKHWRGYSLYRGEDGLIVTSDEEWEEFNALLGHSPMFWTPHHDLADRLYRRSGTLLTCQPKTGSVGWWLMIKHESNVAQALLAVLQEFLMDLTRGLPFFRRGDRISFRLHLKRLQAPRNKRAYGDPVTYWSSKGAGRRRTGWPLDLIAVTLHTMRLLFGDTDGLLPQVLHAGEWDGGEPTAYDSAEIVVLDSRIYTQLEYLVPLLPRSRPIASHHHGGCQATED